MFLASKNHLFYAMSRSSHPEVFCKKVFSKFRKIQRKTLVPESLF